MKKPDNIQIYNENAKQLVARYQRTTTEKALSPFVHALNEYAGSLHQALDVGSGSGRDSFWMAEHGWNVDAIDGSESLLEEAKTINNHPKIHYFYDLAPAFNAVEERNTKYNVILMSGFIFHFEKTCRESILTSCMNFLSHECLLYITLRDGPALPDRHIFNVPIQEMESFALQNGLKVKYHGNVEDSSGLDNISWDHLSIWRGTAWDHVKDYSF